MRILLDTQVWLWMAGFVERLSAPSRALVENPDNDVYLSAASAWEIAIKHAIGKLPLPEPPFRFIPKIVEAQKVRPMPIEHAHALHLATLPHHHRDPFDRILVAQAQLENLAILTADPIFDRYDVETINAQRA